MKYHLTYELEKSSISSKGLLKTVKNNITSYLFGEITQYLGENPKSTDTLKNIIKYYELYGEKFINKIDGYFLIIIFDNTTNTLYLFNNRYSDTYCNYILDKNYAYFSDSVSWIIPKLQEKPKIDFEIVNLYLNSGYTFSENKMIKGIKHLCPGYYMKFKGKESELIKYNSMNFNRKKIKNFKEKLIEYENIWVSSIERFTKSFKTKKLGSALSGGLDTSWVVKTAADACKDQIESYTCDFKYDLYNESKYAKYVADKCKANHTKIYIDESDLDYLPEMIKIAEEPVLSTGLSIYKLIKKAKTDNVDTLLVGDGGNNIYHHLYPVTEVHKYVKNLPYFVRKKLYNIVKKIATKTNSDKLWQLMYVLHPMKEKDMYPDFYKNLICYRHFTKEEREKLFKKPQYKEYSSQNAINKIPITKQNFTDQLIESRFTFGNMQYVCSYHEKFLRHNNMNFYAPYQTQPIMDFLCSIPLNILNKGNTFQKMTNNADKMFFQKKALLKYFKKFLIKRNGQPFDQPFHGWFQERPNVIDVLFEKIKTRDWYNNEYLDQLLSEHKKQQLHSKLYCQLSNHAHRIMGLLSLEIWTMIFIDGIKPKYENNKPINLEKFLRLKK